MFKKIAIILSVALFIFNTNAYSAGKEKQYQVLSFFFGDPKGNTEKFLSFMKYASDPVVDNVVKKLQNTIDENQMLSFVFENYNYDELISFQIYKSKHTDQKYYAQYYKLVLEDRFDLKHECHKNNIQKLNLSDRINRCYLGGAHYFSLVEKPTVMGPKTVAELLEYGFDFIDRTTSLHRLK
jgi:hypothetical protein